jgi:hypothetical protein
MVWLSYTARPTPPVVLPPRHSLRSALAALRAGLRLWLALPRTMAATASARSPVATKPVCEVASGEVAARLMILHKSCHDHFAV